MSDRDKPALSKRSRIREANEQRILDAALPLFAKYGFRGTTVDQLAQASGLSKPNMLYYFRRKQDIYLAVLEQILHMWLEPLETLDVNGDPSEQLRKYIDLKIAASEKSPDASRVYASEIQNGAPVLRDYLTGPLFELVHSKCEVIQQWIDDGRIRNVSPMHLLFAIWSTTQHYADFKTQVDILSDNSAELFPDARKTLHVLLVDSLIK